MRSCEFLEFIPRGSLWWTKRVDILLHQLGSDATPVLSPVPDVGVIVWVVVAVAGALDITGMVMDRAHIVRGHVGAPGVTRLVIEASLLFVLDAHDDDIEVEAAVAALLATEWLTI